MSRYSNWHNAKYGDQSTRDFVKLHTITAANGPIRAFEVTKAHAHDSPAFQNMIKRIPHGSGMIALDAAYDSNANCDAIVEKGKNPVIKPRNNSVARGNSARSKMIRSFIEDHGSFMISYGIRNLAEAVFSAMKERMGSFVRARSLPTQTTQAVRANIVLQPINSVN